LREVICVLLESFYSGKSGEGDRLGGPSVAVGEDDGPLFLTALLLE